MADPRDLIIEHALPLVPFDGWSEYTLLQAAKKAGLDAQQLRSAFPGGPADCIDYFFERADDALGVACPAEDLKEKRVPDRIEALVLARLEHFKPHKEAVRRAAAWRAMPWHASGACRSLYRTVDRMWKLSGDASTDFSFYTKRATLAALYASTLLYWLNDTSENIENTKDFLKRGLTGIAAFGKKKKAFKDKFRAA